MTTGSRKDPAYIAPDGRGSSGMPLRGAGSTQPDPVANLPSLSAALVDVESQFDVTMNEIAEASQETDFSISSTYLYKLRNASKDDVTLEKFTAIVVGLKDACGSRAAVYFLSRVFGLDSDVNPLQVVWLNSDPPKQRRSARRR